MQFEIIDHTADAGIVAYGSNLEEAFANAARGMFSLICDIEGLRDKVYREINIEAPDQEALLVGWLNELLYLFDVDKMIFHRFDIMELEQNRLYAKAWGENIDRSRHKLKTEVKAATYHSLKIDKGNGYRVQVILDL